MQTSTERAPISVVIPAYNAAHVLRQTLDSVAAQTLGVSEILVIDDGSSDGTAAVAEAWGARVISRPNRGVSAARNTGIEAATQPWVALLDSDDIWHPEKIARQWRAIVRYPAAVMAACDFYAFSHSGITYESRLALPDSGYAELHSDEEEDGARYFPNVAAEIHRTAMFLLPSGTVIRRDVLVAAGMFDPTLRLCEDFDCFLRVLNRGPLVMLEAPLFGWRRHARNSSNDTIGMALSYADLHDRVVAAPGQYPPAVPSVFASRVVEHLELAGELLLRDGRQREARASLRRAARHRLTGRGAALWGATWVPPRTLFALISVVKRMKSLRAASPFPS